MRRFITTILVSAALAAIVGAQGQTAKPSLAEQVKMIQRNRELYKIAVYNGLTQAEKFDPLERAHVSTELAKEFGAEMRKAAEHHDSARVVELGQHLNRVVDQGVAANLSLARKNIKVGSKSEEALRDRRDKALEDLKSLEESIRQNLGPDNSKEVESILKGIREGRTKVEKAAEATEK
ncbi:MAG TPA: hypothetical protein VGZ47_14625 [Gemmataceae bacterium]|nr:hypothetical protein [Gemmataceae bacterium]